MSALCFILMLLIFITIPTLIYTFFHVIKCPPNTLQSSSSTHSPPTPPADASVKAGFGRVELVTVIDVARLENAKEEARGDCPVCLSAFEDGEELWQLKLCRHHFHAPCIEPWLHAHSSCPVCRAYVVFPKPPKRSLVVPAAARESDLWQGLPDSAGLV